MSRPTPVVTTVLLVCIAFPASLLSNKPPVTPNRARSKRPSVLLIMSDQLNASVLSCYGGPVPTPHIDRLAREGVRFTQAVCTTPFCSPTRASIVTGMYPHAHGIAGNCLVRSDRGGRGRAQEGIKIQDATTEKLLHEAGYVTHHYGKWHLSGDDLPYYPDMYRPGVEYAKEMAATFEAIRGRHPDDRLQWYRWLLPVAIAPEYQRAVDVVGDRWNKVSVAKFIAKMGRLELPLEQHFDVRVGDHTVERIQAVDGKPFMITCSFNAPHDPNVVPSPYYEAFDPEGIAFANNRHFREEQFEKQWSRRIVADLGEPGLREFLRIYYGMVKLIDDQVGRIVEALEATGRLDDTVIVFTSDHGDMAGGHGMVWKSTHAFYEEVVRVPLVIRYPGRLKPRTCGLAVDLTDIMPTLLDLVELPIPAQVQGQDLIPFLTGQRDASQARRFSYCERVNRNPNGAQRIEPGTEGSFMIRGEGWKYIRYAKGHEYLYHLAEDPGEIRNLVNDAKHSARRKKMEAELDSWLRRTGWQRK